MAAEAVANPELDAKMDDLSIDSKAVRFTQDTKEEPIILKTPIAIPAAATVIPSNPQITPEQQTKYDDLLKTVKTWKEIAAKDDLGGPVTDEETMWLSKECLLRYLRATKWVVVDAEKRLNATLTWRREFGVIKLTPEHISPENETGKQLILGYDVAGRPCHYLSPGRQNTAPSHRQVEHLVFMVERVLDMGLPGQDTLALLINFKTSKTRTNTAPGIGIAREILNILQTHYPERLGRALIINMPWLVNGFFKLITPFIDPLTREKLKFGGDMRPDVPPEQLWNEFQGDLNFEYDHESYWPALLKMCDERRSQKYERWVKAGRIIGESEFYLKGGDASSIGPGPTVSEGKDIVPSVKEEKPVSTPTEAPQITV